MKHVVTTGLGIVSSIGNSRQGALASPCEGCSGITFPQELKDSGTCSHAWGSVKLDTTDLIDRKVVRFMNDASIYAFLSVEQVIIDAGPSPGACQSNPCAGLIAGPDGGSPRLQAFGADATRNLRGLKVTDPYVITKVMASGVSACLVAPFKIHGANHPISSACAAFAHCVGNTVGQVQLGKQDIVFVDGGEELCWEIACEFDAIGALPTKYNDTPEGALRTHDAHRDSFVIVGGGGAAVVEKLEYALACGAHIYAETVGYGAVSDGADMVAPSGEGAVHCMEMATYGVGTPANYLNSYGTSTPVGDVRKLAVIREVLGDKGSAISATKVMIDRSLGAAGVREAIYSLLVPEHGLIAPSINIEEPDKQAAGLNTMTEMTDRELTIVMSNNSSFGGTNTALAMCKLRG